MDVVEGLCRGWLPWVRPEATVIRCADCGWSPIGLPNAHEAAAVHKTVPGLCSGRREGVTGDLSPSSPSVAPSGRPGRGHGHVGARPATSP